MRQWRSSPARPPTSSIGAEDTHVGGDEMCLDYAFHPAPDAGCRQRRERAVSGSGQWRERAVQGVYTVCSLGSTRASPRQLPARKRPRSRHALPFRRGRSHLHCIRSRFIASCATGMPPGLALDFVGAPAIELLSWAWIWPVHGRHSLGRAFGHRVQCGKLPARLLVTTATPAHEAFSPRLRRNPAGGARAWLSLVLPCFCAALTAVRWAALAAPCGMTCPPSRSVSQGQPCAASSGT